MNENEDNFESLRRLLALKRHETPPPGYFDHFSREVMARLRAGELDPADTAAQTSWLARLFSAFEAKPAFAGAFASALCLVLLFGIVYAERPDAAPQPLLPAPQIASSLVVAPPVNYSALPVEPAAAQLASISSTNPVFNAQPVAAWFNSQPAVVQQIPYRLQ